MPSLPGESQGLGESGWAAVCGSEPDMTEGIWVVCYEKEQHPLLVLLFGKSHGYIRL